MEVLSAVQSAISENEAMNSGTIETREGRADLNYYSPIIFWIGWVTVILCGLYVATVYVGPALFGTRPYGQFYYGRNIRKRREAQRNDGLVSLAEKILSSIEEFNNKQ